MAVSQKSREYSYISRFFTQFEQLYLKDTYWMLRNPGLSMGCIFQFQKLWRVWEISQNFHKSFTVITDFACKFRKEVNSPLCRNVRSAIPKSEEDVPCQHIKKLTPFALPLFLS